MNEDWNGNRKFFWKVINVKGENVESCSRIKDRNSRLARGEDKREGSGRSILKICVTKILRNMCGFDGIWRCNYFGGEAFGSAKVEVKVGKLMINDK